MTVGWTLVESDLGVGVDQRRKFLTWLAYRLPPMRRSSLQGWQSI